MSSVRRRLRRDQLQTFNAQLLIGTLPCCCHAPSQQCVRIIREDGIRMLIESGAWRGRLDVLAAKASKIAIAEIIGENEDDVGLAGVGTGPSRGASNSSPHRFYETHHRTPYGSAGYAPRCWPTRFKSSVKSPSFHFLTFAMGSDVLRKSIRKRDHVTSHASSHA